MKKIVKESNQGILKNISPQIESNNSLNKIQKEYNHNNSENIESTLDKENINQSISDEAQIQITQIKIYNGYGNENKKMSSDRQTIASEDNIKLSLKNKESHERITVSNKFPLNTQAIQGNQVNHSKYNKTVEFFSMTTIIDIDDDIDIKINHSRLNRSNSAPIDTTMLDKNDDYNENFTYKKKWVFCKICKLGK